MKGKYFTVEVKPVMTPATAGLTTTFGDGDVLFDFGGGNSLTVQGVTLAQITDDILA